jgi:tetratricopeptide (TPR) repeat protein
LTVDLAEVELLLNEYEKAQKSLEALLQTDGDQKELRARIIFAKTLSRLGDFDLARRHLETVVAHIERWPELVPALYTSLGEVAFESSNLQDARVHFEKAAALWTDAVPDGASVEARSYLGLVDVGRDPRAADKVKASMNQAKKMGRLALEAQCRVHLARIYIDQRRFADAVTALTDFPVQSGEATIGPELEAMIHFWRGRALEGRGDLVGAGTEVDQATNLTRSLRETLSPSARDRFAARPEIRSMLEQTTVRKRG